MSLKTTRIEGQRLDVVLQRIRERDGPNAILDIEPTEEYGGDGIGYRPPLTSVEALLTDFVMPLITDPAIFEEYFRRGLLEDLRRDWLPGLEDNPEMQALLDKVIEEEIERLDIVCEHRQSAIAS